MQRGFCDLAGKAGHSHRFLERESYHSVTEMKLEIQNKLATYLPVDFNWYRHLGVIEYIEMH